MAKSWRLTGAEVHERVSAYDNVETTAQLYQFGKMLIDANRERTQQLENKAVALAGFATAVLAFLVSREPSKSLMADVAWPPRSIAVASICAAFGLACVLAATFVRSHAWFSDSQWFESDNAALENADTLLRCHVLAMHSVNDRMRISNDRKADFVLAGQCALIGAAACLAVWVLWR